MAAPLRRAAPVTRTARPAKARPLFMGSMFAMFDMFAELRTEANK
jgi:hypothetical protein